MEHRMTIEKTVEIPVSHRLTIEIPREVPVGIAKVTLTIIDFPQTATPVHWVNPLKGLCKGSKLTLERFEEMRRKDNEVENEFDQRLRSDAK